ncbi:MAG: OsmC family protein [Cyclobacteriaceae bacterium]|nr:OsmC family protein [Cyclobacteriaceae bacterium]MCX7637770.1 OsmC family protein [Cyclobacteriaceae bacterium]MDW8331842.1 OsmC family protein [Cyclobacteriaceae bacterium]
MKIITRMLEDEVYEAANAAGHTVRIDMRDASVKQNQSPVELLLSSVSACAAVDIVIMLKKRRKMIHDFTIETTGVRKDDPPRRFTDIHCLFIITSPDVTEEELHKVSALSLEKYCSVAATLNSKITFSVQVVRPQ